MTSSVIIAYAALNVASFFLVSLDKRNARRGRRRVRERTFFLLALCLGALGIWAGMYAFRHKTKHVSFVLGIPVLLLLNLGLLFYLHN